MSFARRVSLFQTLLVFAGALLLQGCAPTQTHYSLTDTLTPYGESYAVVISAAADADGGWHAVAEALLQKHPGATLVRHTARLDTAAGAEEVRAALAKLMPRHTAFVAQTSECGRDAIAAIHRLTRKLDDDPWLDTHWGVITGEDAAAALRTANAAAATPLIVRHALSTTGLNSTLFDEHYLISDGAPGAWNWKRPADTAVFVEREPELSGQFKNPSEDVAAFADHFARSPDLVVTSFHGFEDGVEMPFSRGIVRVGGDGRLHPFADPRQTRPADGAAPLADSPNPKVYFPVGNCLVGHVNSPRCMVTAMLGHYGVVQMAAYTVNTWFGRGGWGMLDLWQTHPGHSTFSEAFFLNQQWMLHDLAAADPAALRYEIRLGDGEVAIWPHLANMLRAGLKFDPRKIGGGGKSPDRQLAGLLWDIDTVAFYGDPAWKALLREPPAATPAFTAALTSVNNRHTLRIQIQRRAKMTDSATPVGFLFGTRIAAARVLSGSEYKPVIGDNFLLLLNPVPRPGSNEITVEFEAERLPWPPVAAAAAPASVPATAADATATMTSTTVAATR